MFEHVTEGDVDDCAVIAGWEDDECTRDCTADELVTFGDIRRAICQPVSKQSYGSYAAAADDDVSLCATEGTGCTWYAECPEGYYCNAGKKVECDKDDEGLAQYCIAGSSMPLICAAGKYCPDATQQKACTINEHYCPRGQKEFKPCPDGATCFSPSQPELIILDDQGKANVWIQKRENAIVDAARGVSNFQYSVSLSCPPLLPESKVVLNVTVDLKQGPCDTDEPSPEPRLELLNATLDVLTLVFSKDNWNVSQSVHAWVRTDDVFNGLTQATFVHSIELVDNVPQTVSRARARLGDAWSTPYEQSVSFNLVDDDQCGDGAQKRFSNTEGVDVCVCSTGHYAVDLNDYYCKSVLTCNVCKPGMVCDDVQDDAVVTLPQIEIAAGWYRESTESDHVVECPKPDVCVGSEANALSDVPGGGTYFSADLCQNGHTGPFCMVCTLESTARYVWSGDSCIQCTDQSVAVVYTAIVVVAFLLIWVAIKIFKTVEKRLSKEAEIMEDGRWAEFIDSAQTKYKIGVRFMQTLSKIVVSYPIAFPTTFANFMARLSAVFVFIDINFLPFNCVFETNFHDRLLIMTVGPAVFVAFVVLLYGVQRCRLKEVRKIGQLQAKCVYMVVIFAFTIFPIVSATILRTFHYDHSLGGGRSFLKADYSIEQDDEEHLAFVSYGMCCMVVYCMGIPLCSLGTLYLNSKDIKKLQENEAERLQWEEKYLVENSEEDIQRHEEMHTLNMQAKAMKDANPWLIGLSVLYKDYEAKYWWFEVLQFCTTLFLCGLATTLPTSGASQVFISLLVSMVQLGVCANCHPYIYEHDDFLAQACEVSLTFTLSVGLLSMSGDSYKDETFAPLLIGFTRSAFLPSFLPSFLPPFLPSFTTLPTFLPSFLQNFSFLPFVATLYSFLPSVTTLSSFLPSFLLSPPFLHFTSLHFTSLHFTSLPSYTSFLCFLPSFSFLHSF
jgi:hypothetical protein